MRLNKIKPQHRFQIRLCGRNIPFCDMMLKVQLYEIIKAYKPKYKSFMMLILLPYCSDINPVELIWVDVKQWVGANNTTFCINDTKHLCEQKFEETGADKWICVCEHIEKLEKQCYEQESIIDILKI